EQRRPDSGRGSAASLRAHVPRRRVPQHPDRRRRARPRDRAASDRGSRRDARRRKPTCWWRAVRRDAPGRVVSFSQTLQRPFAESRACGWSNRSRRPSTERTGMKRKALLVIAAAAAVAAIVVLTTGAFAGSAGRSDQPGDGFTSCLASHGVQVPSDDPAAVKQWLADHESDPAVQAALKACGGGDEKGGGTGPSPAALVDCLE